MQSSCLQATLRQVARNDGRDVGSGREDQASLGGEISVETSIARLRELEHATDGGWESTTTTTTTTTERQHPKSTKKVVSQSGKQTKWRLSLALAATSGVVVLLLAHFSTREDSARTPQLPAGIAGADEPSGPPVDEPEPEPQASSEEQSRERSDSRPEERAEDPDHNPLGHSKQGPRPRVDPRTATTTAATSDAHGAKGPPTLEVRQPAIPGAPSSPKAQPQTPEAMNGNIEQTNEYGNINTRGRSKVRLNPIETDGSTPVKQSTKTKDINVDGESELEVAPIKVH